jgi:putative transposase
MPDHVHALLWLPETGLLSLFMHGWKRMSSFNIRNWCREHAPNYGSEFDLGDRFWQPKYYSFSIYSRKNLEEKIQYIHLNPVRAGLVEKAVDWKWGSARWLRVATDGWSADWLDRLPLSL